MTSLSSGPPHRPRDEPTQLSWGQEAARAPAGHPQQWGGPSPAQFQEVPESKVLGFHAAPQREESDLNLISKVCSLAHTA